MRATAPLLAGLAIVLLAGKAPAETVPLGTYRSSVRDCLAATKGGTTASSDACRRFLDTRQVSFPDGQTVAVDNRSLAADLRQAKGSDAARRSAAQKLQSLYGMLGISSGGGESDPRTQAAAILQRDEYRDASAPPPPKSGWDRFWERVGKAIERFFERLFGSSPSVGRGTGALGQTILYLLGGIAIVAAIVGLATLSNRLWERQTRKRAGGSLLANLDEGAGDDPLSAARASAERGDYRTALRLTYLSCLRRLFAAGLLVPQDDWTNWEYQRALRRRSPEAYDILLTVTRDFDRIWYGEQPATAQEYENALAAYSALPEPLAKATPVGAAPSANKPKGENPW